jgi:leucyl aminopeptidase
MQVTLSRLAAADIEADALVLVEFEGSRRADLSKPLASFYDSGEIKGKESEFTLLHGLAGYKARRILIAGAGKRGKFNAAALRDLAGRAVRFLKPKGIPALAIALDAEFGAAGYAAAAVEGAILGMWEPDCLKTDNADKDRAIDSFTIAVAGEHAVPATALEQGRIIAEAANVARDIAVEPPNLLTPLTLAERARRVAEASGIAFEVLDQNRMRQLGMGALLGVAQGSAAPPALIVMRYTPEKASSSDHLAIVGKGVTFDTGGISIKPADGMEKMKYDMAGGAAVIGAMQAIAKLKPPVAVTGIVPAVENMPGSNAQRPGDIVKSLSGKTIEILNTDAEGRLILADAISYAKQLGATHLVDAATLTGAIVVALGHTSSGVFSNNDDLLARWMAAAKEAGEKMWHMPLDEDYRDQLRTVYADIQNVGTRWGGACTAATFLKEFADDTPWVHVDVAGTAWLDDARPHMAKGPTGTPLASFVTLAMNWHSNPWQKS